VSVYAAVSDNQHWYLLYQCWLMMISAPTDIGAWCHLLVLLCPWISYVPDTDLWLLVSGLIREGCVGTVVPWILYVRHYLKRVITKGSLCSSDGSAQQWWQRAVEGRAMVVATPRQQAVVGQAARLSDGAPPHCQAAVGAVGGGVMTAIFGRRRRSGGLHRG
jgi:hypothetical protein